MSSPEKHPSARQAARRKLLRGAFAAPAVLTLHSGSALATGSSLRCLQYQANTVPTTKPTGGMDAFVRVPVYPMTTNPNRYFIKGSDVFGKWVTGRHKTTWGIASTQYQEFNPAATGTTANKLIGSPVSIDPGLSSTVTQYASLRFDANGNIMGIGTSGSGSAMPGTCWLSAAPFV